ncbi:MAG TPA: nitrate/nitrite transporter NrtS [Ferruginibacter sp.]|nr:nitrate/nitrite transporter NrtS [Ferruginibacter sp.]HMP20151.1 nitrate/nitrite transporter NrtS [Ferruginibacter sp.]
MASKHFKAALILAVIVGSLLNIINSYDVIATGNFTGKNVFKIILTYITPFCVSLYSSARVVKQQTN